MKESKIPWCQPVPQLPVLDVETAQKYYRDVLGFDIAWTYEKSMGAVSRGRVSHIFCDRRKFSPTVHWIFAEDVDSTYHELKMSDANIVGDLENKPWNLRQFTLEDLYGHFYHDL